MLSHGKVEQIIVGKTNNQNYRKEDHAISNQSKQGIANHLTGEARLIENRRPGLLVPTAPHGVSARVSVMPMTMVSVVPRA